jgi:hypothetical protein
MEVDKGTVLLSVRPDHSEQLHSSVLLWVQENFAYRFSVNPCEESASTGWTRSECANAIRKTSFCCCQVVTPKARGSKHWHILSAMRIRCHACSARGVNRKVLVKCLEV